MNYLYFARPRGFQSNVLLGHRSRFGLARKQAVGSYQGYFSSARGSLALLDGRDLFHMRSCTEGSSNQSHSLCHALDEVSLW